jgi:hypothetical protein
MLHCVSIQRSRRAICPGGIAGKGTSKMTILSALRERLSGPDASAESRSVGDAQRDPVEEARVPFAGYDRLDERQVVHGLSEHSQIELEAIESYEQSHESRQPVLDKLRWMRGREPRSRTRTWARSGRSEPMSGSSPTAPPFWRRSSAFTIGVWPSDPRAPRPLTSRRARHRHQGLL